MNIHELQMGGAPEVSIAIGSESRDDYLRLHDPDCPMYTDYNERNRRLLHCV
jgi:hypothetical protein